MKNLDLDVTYFYRSMDHLLKVKDDLELAREAGSYNLWVSNAHIKEKPLTTLCQVLDAASVNL